ncbi:uncharacterized protein [Arachis hypogaea]|uniref:uncharacterized protein isoform X1 n=1 Tax=Arachis hypogaea TaxID=3818 RepID=UPI0007891CEE
MADGTLQSNRHHCAAPLSNDVVRSFETTHWTVLPFIRDSFCMIGYAIGATTSAFYGFINGTTCDSVLFCLCRTRRWGCSFFGTTCILILSCSILSSCLTSAIDG